MQYRALSLAEIQKEELSLLLQIDAICRKENLRYTLCGGTLLGAIRHKGFIPWDDDIDIAMPRPDFNKFIEIVSSNKGIGEIEIVPDGDFPAYAKFVNKKIKAKEVYVKRMQHLWVDVLPIDALPSNDDTLHRMFKQAKRYRDLLALGLVEAEGGKTLLKRWLKKIFLPLIIRVGIPNWGAKQLYSLCTKQSFGSTNFVGCISWGLYGPGERYPLAGFEHLTHVDFEGHMFPAISCWDSYLSGIYGDYMTLPPENQRHTHGLKAWKAANMNEERGM